MPAGGRGPVRTTSTCLHLGHSVMRGIVSVTVEERGAREGGSACAVWHGRVGVLEFEKVWWGTRRESPGRRRPRAQGHPPSLSSLSHELAVRKKSICGHGFSAVLIVERACFIYRRVDQLEARVCAMRGSGLILVSLITPC